MKNIYLKYRTSNLPATLLATLLATLPASFTSSASAASNHNIIVWDRTYDNPNILEVLELALQHTSSNHKPHTLVRSEKMEQGRVMHQLKTGTLVDVAAFAPTIQREEDAIAIRIPVSRGLLGYRVCLIRKDRHNDFANIDNLQDWKSSGFRIGQGTHWPDTAILESNGITVEKSTHYMPLFKMLKKNRFDCFARSINEVFLELQRPENKELTLDPYLMFQYRLPTFFFVNKQKPELARRIEKGLNLAIQDGSFQTLFDKHHGDAIRKSNITKRTVIKLDNPNLSDKTRHIINMPELWLDSQH